MLNEYQVASGGTVRLEVIDPAQNPDKEAEANQVYGIQPTPFQVTGRYEASVINSYFDILVQYGDQSETLTFGDLIEVEQNRDGTLDVRLQQSGVRPDEYHQEGRVRVPEHRCDPGCAGGAG